MSEREYAVIEKYCDLHCIHISLACQTVMQLQVEEQSDHMCQVSVARQPEAAPIKLLYCQLGGN